MRRRRLACKGAGGGAGIGGCYGGGGYGGSLSAASFLVWLTLATAAAIAVHHTEDGVCQSVDVRNKAESLEALRGCRVVEGFVHILLIDHSDENSYSNYSFPELVEITDYLLVYRVRWIRSLSGLFPNLAVIRGNRLIHNYALAIYENLNLQDVGLYSLSHILRGSVRIETNPMLCFADTLDWDAVADQGHGEHVVTRNNFPGNNNCPPCPDHCARHSVDKRGHCWTAQHCQITCTDNKLTACYSLSNDTYAGCNDLCLGGCSGPGEDDCTLCKIEYNKRCVKRCPKGTYNYLGRRCIGREQCRSMPPPKILGDINKEKQWKAFQQTCILTCPPNYTEVNGTCEPCSGPCRKECAGGSISSIANAQKLRGCTYITGALEIQVRGGKNIVKELEENLYSIEEISGYLKIVRSFPLISLNFLKNLRIIHGNILESQRYALLLLDNQNIQELWDWNDNRKLEIPNGTIFFHFNPKLCIEKIQKLVEIANLKQPTENDVATNSNGDKIACNLTELEVTLTGLESQAAVIEWNPFKHHDDRTLLGYVIYSIEAPVQNLTWYDSRDACGGDGWRVNDVPSNMSSDIPLNKSSQGDDNQNEARPYLVFTLLKPYTQYGYYVKTYTIASERRGAQSKIKYFRTLPFTPSKPLNLKVESNSSNSIIIEWSPPLSPNGNITSYDIYGYIHENIRDTQIDIDYCKTVLPPETAITLPQLIPTQTPSTTPTVDKECDCDKTTTTSVNEHDRQLMIDFENYIQNLVFIKRTEQIPPDSTSSENVYEHRKRRQVNGHSDIPDHDDVHSASNKYKTLEDKRKRTQDDLTNVSATPRTFVLPHNFSKIVENGQNKTVITGLSHFTLYIINVKACRKLESTDPPNATLCSEYAMITARTLHLEGADMVYFRKADVEDANTTLAGSSSGSSHNLGRVRLSWDPPKEPNGPILSYQIQYRRVDIQNHKPQTECMTNKVFLEQNHSYTLTNLSPGNYSIIIHAVSRWGRGPDTEPIYVFIPERPHNSIELVIGIIIGFIIVIGFIIGCIVYIRRKYAPGVPNMKLIASVNPEYMSTAYVPDEWELPRNKVDLIRELGQGSFGMVYEGIVHDLPDCRPGIGQMRCAVKTVNVNATDRERSEFLNEASVMKAFNTHHVVRLLGVVSQGQPVLVVMELMARGDLKSFLRSHRPDEAGTASVTATGTTPSQPPSLFRFLQMSAEIADGMAYLAAKKFVHRDLAARNCMVAEDLTVKIGDFGMTRDIYETDYYRKGTKGLLPVRWMAPESLKDGVFTSCSDVWSYGVVLWEMATLASQPYQGLSNDQVLRYVIDGGVMERPGGCPERLFDLMRQCWQHKPTLRPQFLDILDSLLSRGEVTFPSGRSFYHSSEGVEHRQQAALRDAVYAAQMDDDPSTPLRLTRDVEDFSVDDNGVNDLEDGGSNSDLDGDQLHEHPHNNPKLNPTSTTTCVINGEYETMNGNSGTSSNGINSPSSDVGSLHRHHHHSHHGIRHLHNSPTEGPPKTVAPTANSNQPNGHWPPLKTSQC